MDYTEVRLVIREVLRVMGTPVQEPIPIGRVHRIGSGSFGSREPLGTRLPKETESKRLGATWRLRETARRYGVSIQTETQRAAWQRAIARAEEGDLT